MSRRKIDIDHLASEVKDILAEYGDELRAEVAEAGETVAAKTVEFLRTAGDYKGHGKYRKSFTHLSEKDGRIATSVVYVKGKQYRLTHLLENGHDIRTEDDKLVGTANAFPHWTPAEKFAQREYEAELVKRVDKVGLK